MSFNYEDYPPFLPQNNHISMNQMSKILNEKNINDGYLNYQIVQALKKLSNHYYNNPNFKKSIENSMIFNYYCSPFINQQNNCSPYDPKDEDVLNFSIMENENNKNF